MKLKKFLALTAAVVMTMSMAVGCGSDDSNMYEYYDEFGRPYYECTVCGYWTYDESDFYE